MKLKRYQEDSKTIKISPLYSRGSEWLLHPPQITKNTWRFSKTDNRCLCQKSQRSWVSSQLSSTQPRNNKQQSFNSKPIPAQQILLQHACSTRQWYRKIQWGHKQLKQKLQQNRKRLLTDYVFSLNIRPPVDISQSSFKCQRRCLASWGVYSMINWPSWTSHTDFDWHG